MPVRPWFCLKHGEALLHRVAKHRQGKEARIASPVLTSGPILATLVEVVNERRCDVGGVVDDTRRPGLPPVADERRARGKVPLLQRIIEGAEFSGKVSIPWAPTRCTISCARSRHRRRHDLRRQLQLRAPAR